MCGWRERFFGGNPSEKMDDQKPLDSKPGGETLGDDPEFGKPIKEMAKMFEINPTEDGKFSVLLPEALLPLNKSMVSGKEQTFSSQEEAEQAVMKSKEDAREFFSRFKTKEEAEGNERLGDIFPTEEGKWEVVLPGLKDESGRIVGYTKKVFDTLEQAEAAAQE